MDAFRTLATLLPLGLSSGINLYATVLVIGLSIRFGWVANPPSGLQVLAAWPVIAVAAVFYLIEFFADKIQFVDNLWDVIHTFVRPLGAAMIGWATLSKADPVFMVVGSLAMGSVALISHGGKAGARAAVNVASPFENLSNIILSLGEDVFAAGLTFLALRYPLIAGLASLLVLVLLIILVPQVLRWALFMGQALVARFASLLRHQPLPPDVLPPWYQALLAGEQPEAVILCRSQGLPGARAAIGYLVLTPQRLCFAYDGRSGPALWSVPLAQLRDVRLVRRLLLDTLSTRYLSGPGRAAVARFIFLKDRSAPADALALRLAARSAPSGAGARVISTPP